MALIFISYKRGTSAVAPLMQYLESEHYGLWFDRNDIHLCDESWWVSAERGLQMSDALLLCMTPRACTSEQVRREVDRARELGKPIFPVILEKLEDIGAGLEQLGLSREQHAEDFTNVEDWTRNCEKLLKSLKHHGVRVTRHELRERPGELHDLHQAYLRRVADQVGMLNLAQINPEQSSVPLENVYVDSPVNLWLNVEVQDFRVTDWWLSTSKERKRRPDPDKAGAPEEKRLKPADLKLEDAAFEQAVARLHAQIQAYGEEYRERSKRERNWYNRWQDGEHSGVYRFALQDIASACDRLVVLGDPGSGKSTFARHLALCLAGEQLDGWPRPASLARLGSWPHGKLTPIYIPLRRFVESKHFPTRLKDQPTAANLWDFIRQDVLGDTLAGYAGELEKDLCDGYAVLILDGLDEVGYAEGLLADRQKQLQALARSLQAAYGASRMIVASRPYAYDGWTLPGFETITIADFEDEHRTALAANLYREAGRAEEMAASYARRLNQQLGRFDRELKNRPLFVTLMATIFLDDPERGLPEQRGALFRESIWLLLERWTRTRSDRRSLEDILGITERGEEAKAEFYRRLASLAYEVHSRQAEDGHLPDIPEDLLAKHLRPIGGRVMAAELITFLSENAGVLVSPGQDDDHDVFYFAHRSFQEYLAAAHIVELCLEAKDFALVSRLITERPQTWREPVRLVGDVLADNAAIHHADRAATALLLWDVIGDLVPEDAPAVEAADPESEQWWAVWLAASYVLEQKACRRGDLNRGAQYNRDALIDWLVLVTKVATKHPGHVERAYCGRVLSLLGDPRPGVGLSAEGLPDIDWVEIPGGGLLLGSDPKKDEDAKKEEQPQIKINLPTYWIGRYPVTYEQYEAFVNDRSEHPEGGYGVDRYWTEEGLTWRGEKREPEAYWQDEEWHISNHPVVGVTWYEAVAFSRWLSEKLGEQIGLPDEAQWEKAARGSEGLIYPWGNEWYPARVNGGSIRRTSAVGMFPNGASPYGVLDMSGNVWEWCQTQWGWDYKEGIEVLEKHNVLEENRFRVLRGGSWFNSGPTWLRAAVRVKDIPFSGDNLTGFRLARS